MKEPLNPNNYFLLLDNSLRAIPFNMIIAGLLAIDFIYQGVPWALIFPWLSLIVVISVGRLVFTKYVISKNYYLHDNRWSVHIFLLLTLVMGCVWGLSYLFFLSHIAVIHETILILIFGGMSAGAAASLSPYLPAYYSYMLPMFLPVILYNLSFFALERSILAIMFSMFVVMTATVARNNHHLLNKIFQLSDQKDNLINQLSFSNKKLEESNKEIRVLSITDPLTGLYNRRYFDNWVLREVQRAKRNKYPLGLILFDIDNFKDINDTYGHLYGDEYLIFVASVLKKHIRRTNDILVRLGGDEFAAILANMNSDETIKLCEKIRQDFFKKNQHKKVTLSMGTICIEPDNQDEIKTILSAVDKLLYRAKDSGKNQIMSKII